MEVKSKEIIKALIGFGLLYIGFYLMGSVNLHIGLFQELTLLVFSLLAAALIFKNSALEWFRKPEGKYLKIIILCFFANVIWSFIGGALVQIIFGLAGNHGNEAIGNLALLPFVPFMLMGEELFSITLLETFRKNHPKFPSFLNAVSHNALEEGTVIEISVTSPSDKNYVTNIKLRQDDLDFLRELQSLNSKS